MSCWGWGGGRSKAPKAMVRRSNRVGCARKACAERAGIVALPKTAASQQFPLSGFAAPHTLVDHRLRTAPLRRLSHAISCMFGSRRQWRCFVSKTSEVLIGIDLGVGDPAIKIQSASRSPRYGRSISESSYFFGNVRGGVPMHVLDGRHAGLLIFEARKQSKQASRRKQQHAGFPYPRSSRPGDMLQFQVGAVNLRVVL